jgi:molybdate transport system regulatory protein
MTHSRPGRKHPPLVPRIKIWLETRGQYAFGFGLAEILQAVDHAGSIKHGAQDLGKSYRHVWGRIKQAERVLGQQLVETQVGGKNPQRSALTTVARQLVVEFLAVRRRMIQLAEQEFAVRFARLILATRGDQGPG